MQVSTKPRNIANGKYAKIRRLTIFGLVSISSFGVSVRGQTRAETQENAGQQVIRVWKAGSPHRGDVPDNRVRFDLQQRAAQLGCRLEIRVMPARDLSGLMSNALVTNDEPDILVIDNMGLIIGITTPLGRFDGIGRDPVLLPVRAVSQLSRQPPGFDPPADRLLVHPEPLGCLGDGQGLPLHRHPP